MCTVENLGQYVMINASAATVETVFRIISEWAEPYDQYTIEDRQAAWNYCVGQLATLIPTFPCVYGLFNTIKRVLFSVCNNVVPPIKCEIIVLSLCRLKSRHACPCNDFLMLRRVRNCLRYY